MATRVIYSIEHAALAVNLSIRHFRRVYYEEGEGRVFQIGKKFFTLAKDLEKWAANNGRQVQGMAVSPTSSDREL